MKIKQLMLSLILVFVIVMMSGCINATYEIELKDNGKADVNLSVLYNDPEFNYDNEAIEEIKNLFKKAEYEIRDIKKSGLIGFEISKDNIKVSKTKHQIEYGNYKVDILKEILDGISYEKGILSNKYSINSNIDLTSYLNKAPIYDKDGNLISDDEYKKLLSELNLKLIINMQKGSITETNTAIEQKDNKKSEWVLIPGQKNEIKMIANTGDTKAIISTVIIISVVTVISAVFLIIFFRMYNKKKKREKQN